MTVDISRAPFPITYRELWLPPSINGNATLPSSRYNGHGLTSTGARKGTSSDGVRGNGANTSNINCGAIHNNAATLWLKIRFKFTQPYAAGSGDQYLWGKFVDATHFLWLVFKTADGKLYFEGQDGGVNDFSIAAQDGAADITSWNAGQWYTVLASISAVNNVRLILDNGTVVTNASAIAAPNGGDFTLLDYDDPGAGTGFEGIIADVVVGTDNLTVNEEADLYRGTPPADAVNDYLLDEGRGVTAYDRGTGGNNGTLDTSAVWAWGQVQQPLLSLDGINDVAISSAGVDISGDLTLVWAGKVKIQDDPTLNQYLTRVVTDANNELRLLSVSGPRTIIFAFTGAGIASGNCDYVFSPEIDSYLIIICTIDSLLPSIFINGDLVERSTAGGAVLGGATAYIGRNITADSYDVNKPLLYALIDGAFTQKQTLAYSRWLKNIFNLPINI